VSSPTMTFQLNVLFYVSVSCSFSCSSVLLGDFDHSTRVAWYFKSWDVISDLCSSDCIVDDDRENLREFTNKYYLPCTLVSVCIVMVS